MANNTLTLALEGSVSLDSFSIAVHEFNGLINDLTNELTENAKINWVIEDLQSGSALVTAFGDYPDIGPVETVVIGYERIGTALESGDPVPFSQKIKRRTDRIINLLNGAIPAIRFHTQEIDTYITKSVDKTEKTKRVIYSTGTVQGTVQTLSMRGQLRFTLWDDIFDKGVSCFLDEGQEEKMRSVWGKPAIISGRIGRQPDTGLPVSVRDISDIQVIPEIDPGSYRNLRGAIPWKEGQKRPEEIIMDLKNG